MYQITSEVYLDRRDKCYNKIVVISPKPIEPALQSITKLIHREKLSPFQETSPCCSLDPCMYAVVDPNNKCQLMCINDITLLFGYLKLKGFKINTDITKIMQDSTVQIPNLICFISKVDKN